MTYKAPGEWKVWQAAAFRKFFKRTMRPVTVSQVNRRKIYLAAGYLISSLILFNRAAFNSYSYSGPDADIRKAVDLNLSSAKVIRIDNSGVKEIIDYKREDYPEYIENRPPFARE